MYTKCFGDMWESAGKADYFIITTNSYITKDGKAVLGRGIAQQARDRYIGFDSRLGAEIKKCCGHLGEYNLILGKWLGAFQVKYHFRDNADIDLISRSASKLAEEANKRPDSTFYLNYPGIGNGGLSFEQVDLVLRILPENVYVWRFG